MCRFVDLSSNFAIFIVSIVRPLVVEVTYCSFQIGPFNANHVLDHLLQANISSPVRHCPTWQWASFFWRCPCSSSAHASSSLSSSSTPCWRGMWLWSSRKWSTQVHKENKCSSLGVVSLSESLHLCFNDDAWWATQVQPSCCFRFTCMSHSPAVWRRKHRHKYCFDIKSSLALVVICTVTLCSLHHVYCSPPVFLFGYRLPLPLLLGYWIHCNFGGSRDDLHRSEQLCLYLSYNSSRWWVDIYKLCIDASLGFFWEWFQDLSLSCCSSFTRYRCY